MVKVARGLHQSYTNAKDIALEDALKVLQTRTDCYEVLNDTHNRIYLDIDGKNIQGDEAQFDELNKSVQTEIETFFSVEDVAIMTASSFLHRKISFRVILTKKMCSKEDNKNWAKQLKLDLVEGVKIDLGVYDRNRKMRMLGSNKDGENRPLRLVCGTPIDTIISYTEGCEDMKLKPEEKVKPREKIQKAKGEKSKILHILNELPISIIDEYDTWIRIGMVIFNAGEKVDVFKEVSSRSDKYNEKECDSKWATFHQGGLTIWKFLKDDAPEIYEMFKNDDYAYVKTEFEKTHFKVMNPPMIVRMTDTGTLQQLQSADVSFMYRNFFCAEELFVGKWLSDPSILTYENLCFLPKLVAPPNQYNIFKEFPIQSEQGDISTIQSILKLITGNETHVFEYVEKWVAHILQKPAEKTGVAIVVQGEQGIGKDTYFDFVGSILGREYFFNTGDATNDVFGRFTDHLQRTILMKFEEANFITNKSHADKLKSWITAPRRSYEGKGLKPITLGNYTNLVMTTNQELPVLVEDTDRRFCCIKGSSEKRTDREFWKAVHSNLAKQETRNAYYYYLLNLDISQFNPREYPKTEYYESIREALAPYHARYFQRKVEENIEDNSAVSWNARRLFNSIKEDNKFDISEKSFSLHMKIYPETAIAKVRKNSGNEYTLNPVGMMEFLKSKNWWVDL
jgi:hypothetical protein